MKLSLFLSLCLFAVSAAATEPAPKAGAYRKRITTADGTTLALYRYVPAGTGQSRPAVLLVPEFGFNRGAYDFQGEGIARRLQDQGFEVFVVEPRGQGASEAGRDWHLVDVALQDVRAALGAIQALHPGRVDLLVHGYSGGVVLGAASRELKERIRRVVALTPAVTPDPPSDAMKQLLRLEGRWSRLAMSPDGAALFEILFTRNGHLKKGLADSLRYRLVGDLSPVAGKELEEWMLRGELAFPDATTLLSRLHAYDRPTLLVMGLGDNFAMADFASPLRDLAPSAAVTVLVLNRREGYAEDYAHLSMLHGPTAAAEIERVAVRFLLAPDPRAPDLNGPLPAAPDAGSAEVHR